MSEMTTQLAAGSSVEFLPPLPHDPIESMYFLTLARRLLPGWLCHAQFEGGVQKTLAMSWPTSQILENKDGKTLIIPRIPKDAGSRKKIQIRGSYLRHPCAGRKPSMSRALRLDSSVSCSPSSPLTGTPG